MPDGRELSGSVAPAFQDYECQGALFRVLERDFRAGHAVHAYLICGEDGIGKKTLASYLAKMLLCTRSEPPCGECGACKRCANGTHSDLHTLVPGKNHASIGVDQIRDIIGAVGMYAYEGGKRVVLINNTFPMTPQAQNALLKYLEEPASDIIFLLISRDTSALLATIVSRCRILRLGMWKQQTLCDILMRYGVDRDDAEQAARQARGNIGRAVDCALGHGHMRARVMESFFTVRKASQVYAFGERQKDEQALAEAFLTQTEDMFRELLLVRVGHLEASVRDDYPDHWRAFASSASNKAFESVFLLVQRARSLKENNVSWRVIYETLLIDVLEEVNKWQK